jgi:hypothetical protein
MCNVPVSLNKGNHHHAVLYCWKMQQRWDLCSTFCIFPEILEKKNPWYLIRNNCLRVVPFSDLHESLIVRCKVLPSAAQIVGAYVNYPFYIHIHISMLKKIIAIFAQNNCDYSRKLNSLMLVKSTSPLRCFRNGIRFEGNSTSISFFQCAQT